MRLGLLSLSLSCLFSHASGARQLRGGGQEADEVQEVRDQRSLVNTFPFNDVDSQLPERETRQGLDNSVSSIPFSAVASSYAGGKR